MFSLDEQVEILCWDSPTESDRNAGKIATFSGVGVTFVPFAATALRSGALDLSLIPQCTCLIVHAETLAKAADVIATEVCWPLAVGKIAKHAFIYGFQPTERHGKLLQSLSSAGLTRVEPWPNTHAEIEVAGDYRSWCGQFAGLTFEVRPRSSENGFVEDIGLHPHATLIRADGKSFLTRITFGESEMLLSACGELADLDSPVQTDVPWLSHFPRLVPLLMFLRGALGELTWHCDQPLACFIIDDPLLRDKYGFLDYEQLIESMQRSRFSTSIAFIPRNYKRSSGKVADLFLSNDTKASLCVHGCDHTRGEFATTEPASLREKAQLALERMQAHCQLSGIGFDDVMVFPQGLFSIEAMEALSDSGYLASVNTHLHPSSSSSTVALRDLMEVAVTRFADFPLFGRRYPRERADFAFDLFLGKPALVVEHHGYFRQDTAAIEAFAADLNSLDERLEWTSLATICSRACLTRTTKNGDVCMRFYTNRFQLKNNSTETRKFTLIRQWASKRLPPTVTVNGREGCSEREEGQLRILLSLDAGKTADINVLCSKANFGSTLSEETVVRHAWVSARRLLSEFRDNHVDTSRTLSATVSVIRNILRTEKTLGSEEVHGLKPLKWPNHGAPLVSTRSSFDGPGEPAKKNAPINLPSYVLVTPARNEDAYIEKTIRSVVAQTVLPVKWIIVSDGSTDHTDDIVRNFALKYDWIDLVSLPRRAERHFAGKVTAFNAGLERLSETDYDVICNLDADVSFDEDYFAFLLGKLAADPALGLTGTPYQDPLNDPYDYRYVSIEHVTGPCQVFRRQCFEAIGGYLPVRSGAIDRIADISARMKGWKTRTFTEKVYFHHRATGTSQQGIWKSKFKDGGKDYSVGTSAIWELFRVAYQMTKKPILLGGLLTGAGYFWSLARRVKRPIPPEMVEFCRREQMQRLKKLFRVDALL
jgi:poly-beta-1,6-N-acetyl-D-glucosamine synthase